MIHVKNEVGVSVGVADSALHPVGVPRLGLADAVDHAGVDGVGLALNVVLLHELGVLDVAAEQDVDKVGEADLAALLLLGDGVVALLKLVSKILKRFFCCEIRRP